MNRFQIGNHVVYHADIVTDWHHINFSVQADIVYSDPPWGNNLKYFHTLNNKDNNLQIPLLYDNDYFLRRFFDFIARWTKENAIYFIEYSLKQSEFIIELALSMGMKHVQSYTPLYKTGNTFLPLSLMVFTRGNFIFHAPPLDLVNRSYGYATLKQVTSLMSITKNHIVLDPCCGLGYSAKLALDNNAIFYGCELNLKRLSRTIKRLKQ
jgi:DNA modification methylase